MLQLPDTCATFCSILNCTTCNAVHTEKLKPKIDPRYNIFPYSNQKTCWHCGHLVCYEDVW